VVLTEAPLRTQLKVNQYCHSRGIRFISADTMGPFSYAFVDFGDAFEVSDTDGEEPKSCLLSMVSRGKPAVCSILQDQRHDFETGDVVELAELHGPTQLNGRQFPVTGKANRALLVS
jgi:ubiquitin-activating enzyme E1